MDEKIKGWYYEGMDILDALRKDNDISEVEYSEAREKLISIAKLDLNADKSYDKKKKLAMA